MKSEKTIIKELEKKLEELEKRVDVLEENWININLLYMVKQTFK